MPSNRHIAAFPAIALGTAWAFIIASCGENPVDNGGQKDTTRPTVVSTIPADNDSTVSVNTTISVTFSEEMDGEVLTGTVLVLNPPVAGSLNYSNEILTLSPSEPLDTNVIYQATVTTDARDMAGNALASAYVWHFGTYR
ncbi:MAG: Ig-like domain-containing protein, partial [Candidatus Zixiibacteriota bacterium]